MNIFKDEVILITGGTGSFGKKLAKIVLDEYSPAKVIIYSRDELKQFEMSQEFEQYKNIRYFIGDVRDKERLMRAFAGVDYVVHAAALKQVPAMEYNPTEAIKTNINGATKLCSDKLFVAANSYAGLSGTRFSVVRYGNVVGSRGSVVPFFQKKKSDGILPITDPEMTRFWITLEQGVRFVINAFERMKRGELFVPKIPSMNIMDLAKAIAPDCKTSIVGIRPGEKLHEVMISEDDARNTKELDDCYVIQPAFHWWDANNHAEGKNVQKDFRYSSDLNPELLKVDELREIIKNL